MKKLDRITDFIQTWENYEISGISYNSVTWNRRFREAGYVGVEKYFSSFDVMEETIGWCEMTFGKGHYAYLAVLSPRHRFAYNFWFETDKDAMLFSLRWT